MHIDISTLRKEKGNQEAYSFLERPEMVKLVGGSKRVTSPLDIDISATNMGSNILLEGFFELAVQLECSRCTVLFDFPLSGEFSAEYFFAEKIEKPVPENQKLIGPEQDEIDISPLMEEVIILAEPHKTLCSEDCQGICPDCGTDLNHGRCQCEGEAVDPRMEKLRELLE